MKVIENRTELLVIASIFILLISCAFPSFVSIKPILSEEINENDDFNDILETSAVSHLFEGLYITHTFNISGFSFLSNFSYANLAGSVWYETWNTSGMGNPQWQVDDTTRIMSGGSVFQDGNHTPVWIFTDINLGDNILIAVDGEGDHNFNVSGELVYELPGYGFIDLWELEDLTFPGGIAWYEKSTGLLIKGDFYAAGGSYSFEFIETNAIFSYVTLTHEISVSLEVPDNPEKDETYTINATVSNSDLSDETDVDLYLYLDDIIVNSTTISDLPKKANETISYKWTPTTSRLYEFKAYAPPVSGEEYIENNMVIELVYVLANYTMVPGYTYTWKDASSGNELFLSDDELYSISLPFDFNFYNDTFSSVYLCSNGFLSFSDSPSPDFSNLPFPSGVSSHTYMIAPFWDDIYPSYGGHIYYKSFGTYFVAEWLDIHHISIPIIGSFEVVLYDTGDIVFNYNYVNYTMDGYTCGLNFGEDTRYFNSYQGLTNSTTDFSILFYNTPPGPFELDSNAGTPDDDGIFTLTWESSAKADDYTIYEYSNLITTINNSLTILADGTTDLTLPLSGYTDGTYYFRVVANNEYGTTLSDSLKVDVVIPSITVINPDDSSSWEIGSSQYVNWTSTGTISSVRIELYNNDTFVMEIISSTTNDGEYSWTVPSELVESDQYQIKIIDTSTASIYDFSDYFEITTAGGGGGISGYNFYILIGLLGIASIILVKMRRKIINN